MYKITDQGVSTVSAEGYPVFIPADPENSDWQIYLAWLAEGNTPEPKFTEAELAAMAYSAAADAEAIWRAGQMDLIANQLLAIEDDDPSRLPGTDSEWRKYRIKVRAWVSGAVGYPDLVHRPVSPG